jgi:hypothetical protein
MVSYKENPPDARPLMNSARSFGNYDLAGALADLIDNSIKARAHNISLFCHYNDGTPLVRILDDGEGMSLEELHAAMRPASQDPLADRSPDDLGRFGWGMKSASFSQCKKLTVLSRKDGQVSGASWDLDNLDNWKMGVLSETEARSLLSEDLDLKDGTKIIWDNCDRLSEDGTISEPEFNALIVHTKYRLALIFHKYLSGEVRGKRLNMVLNGQNIEPYDPFYSDHNATQCLPRESLKVNQQMILITPYILPHFSKLKMQQHEKLGGEEGFLKNQGFYVYRNHRLIISGTWFRLVRFGELSQLVRISVDIPNSLDDLWKITVDKSDAKLPAVLRTRLKQIVDGLRKRASRVHRSKGGRLSAGSKVAVWTRYARGGEVSYYINRDHPLISALLEGDLAPGGTEAKAALDAIEQGFPVEAFGRDTSDRPDDIHQTAGDVSKFREFLDAALPVILAQEQGDFQKLEQRLRQTEPFCSNWTAVEEYLGKKEWSNA